MSPSRRTTGWEFPSVRLLSQLELLSDGLITVDVDGVEVIQQASALADHHQQSASRTVVLLVLLQVFRQMIDPPRQQRDLNVRRSGIPLVYLEITNRLRFSIHTFQ